MQEVMAGALRAPAARSEPEKTVASAIETLRAGAAFSDDRNFFRPSRSGAHSESWQPWLPAFCWTLASSLWPGLPNP